jgi:lipopolysaccharide export system protein LptA
MRLLLLLVLLGTSLPVLAAERNPFGKATNDLLILSQGPFIYDYTNQTVTFRDSVRVTDGQMLLTCEVLTATYSTNASNETKIERIVAENNVVITQKLSYAAADLAVYTASNDTIVLVGRGVVQTSIGPVGNAVLETTQGFLMSSNVFFDRRSNRMWAEGPNLMRLRHDAFGQQGLGLLSTNAFELPGLRRREPPGRPPDDRTGGNR